MSNTKRKKKSTTKPYISFDFDWTLYDPTKDGIIEEMKEIMEDYIEDGYGVCICTLRGENETARIRELFPDIEIYPTNGFNKAIALKKYIPVPIIKHYDDDLNICIALRTWTSIKPVWVRAKRLIKEMDKLETMDI